MALGGKRLWLPMDYIKKYSNFSESLLEEYFKPVLITVQDTRLKSYLGTDLFDKIESDMAADTLTGNYLTLYEDYIADVLLWWFVHDFHFDAVYKVDNGGIVKRISDDAVDPGKAMELQDRAKRNAVSYSTDLVNYLCNNTDLFPEYLTNTGSDIKPTGVSSITFSNGAKRKDYKQGEA